VRDQGRTGWYASVHQPGPGGVDAILNSYIHREGKPQSVRLEEGNGDPEPSVLLCGLAGLISSGELPKYEGYLSKWIAPDATGAKVDATMVVFLVACIECMNYYALKVKRTDYERLSGRAELIKDLFPYLAPPMCELLISRTCPKCWSQIFGAEDTSSETNGGILEGEGA
jgi:hypothetical protein